MLGRNNAEFFRQRLRLIFACLLAFSFPFTITWFHNLSSYVIWGFGIFSMGYLAIEPRAIKRLLKPELWILTLPFLWALLGMTFSEDQYPGWNYIEKQLSLLIFPFFFVFGGGFNPSEKRWVLKSFLISLAVALLVALALSIQKNYEFDQLRNIHVIFYTYHSLSSRINIHAVYLSVYVGFALFILIDYFLKNRFALNKKFLLALLGTLFFGFFLTLLTAKMVLFSMAMATLIFFFIKGKYKLGIGVTLGSVLILIFYYSSVGKFKTIKQRLDVSSVSIDQVDWSADPENEQPHWNSLNMRLGLWTAAMDGTKKRPVFGPGTGDADRLFMEELEEMGFEFALRRKLNEHNQYLGIINTNGFIGLLFFALMFAYGFKVARNRKDHLFQGFMIFILFCFLTENYIEAQKGAIFIGFFFSFFFFSNEPPKTIE